MIEGISASQVKRFTLADFGVSKVELSSYITKLPDHFGEAWGVFKREKERFEKWRAPLGDSWHHAVEQCGRRGICPDLIDENTIIDLAKRGIIPLEAASAWVGYTKQVKNRFSSKAQRNPNAAELGIARLAHLLGKDLLSISQMDLLNHYDIVLRYLPDHARSLSADLSGAFRFYHERWQKNLLNQQLAKEGRPHREYLTDEEFRGKYGDEPWVVLDRLIQETRGLRYHFSRPERDFDELFRAELINDETGARVPISDLSSGEQVLLKIAVSMQVSNMVAHETDVLPKVLLLDEVDASLHFTMIQNLLNLIQTQLVSKLKADVILTTHSPTTVALAPADALYVMDNKRDGLRKESKEQLLDTLCEGIVRVRERKRFVLVEGQDDKEFYELTFRKLLKAGKLPKQPTLVFVSPPEGAGKKEV